ncbi:MAG: V-type ATP synthase subunit F [Candidatus Aminicenantales bacterium]
MYERVAVVGEKDLVFAFRALGFEVFSPENKDEAKKVMLKLEKEKYAFCLLHQKFLHWVEEERKELSRKMCPVVVVFSDFREARDMVGPLLREIAVRATGSDLLIGRNK